MKQPITRTIFRNVLSDILKEIEKCPNDSIQDIVNEKLADWEIDMVCNHKLIIKEIEE